MKARTALFLYTELAGYMVNCMNTLAEEKGIEVHVVAYPINAEAPFQFDFHPQLTIHNRNEHEEGSLTELIALLKPNWIYCSGWADKAYLKAIKAHSHIPSALAFDNQWEGSAKQKVLSLAARFIFPRQFNFAFVPGERQVSFAKKLGFKKEQIKTGVYCCDVDLFKSYQSDNKSRALLWVGRYIPQKGAELLWNTFLELNAEMDNKWTLHCAGTGADFDQRVQDESIIHHGFVQPENLKTIIQKSACFVLPSHFEPWGVVVHEMAAAGLPIIISSAVGAGDVFVDDNKNGIVFTSEDRLELKNALRKIMSKSPEELHKMGEKSSKMAEKIVPKSWADTVESMMYL
ncbi:MAG: glycosyltransferase family 4 protein [Flavobacteriales bacterium]|nr:glycosyltransferase family 4 protein [Flavobacteriales bacterium]